MARKLKSDKVLFIAALLLGIALVRRLARVET